MNYHNSDPAALVPFYLDLHDSYFDTFSHVMDRTGFRDFEVDPTVLMVDAIGGVNGTDYIRVDFVATYDNPIVIIGA